MAESIFRHKVRHAGLEDVIHIESAGTGNWHAGENPDPRTIKVLRENGIEQYSRARQVQSRDFDTFHYIVAMDDANVADLYRWEGSKHEKVSTMLNWGSTPSNATVPDPYYGDQKDFQEVYRLLDQATDELLVKLMEIHQIKRTD